MAGSRAEAKAEHCERETAFCARKFRKGSENGGDVSKSHTAGWIGLPLATSGTL